MLKMEDDVVVFSKEAAKLERKFYEIIRFEKVIWFKNPIQISESLK